MPRDLPEHEIIGGDSNLPDDGDSSGAGTDLWFARRIAREHGDSLKYVWPWRTWMAWQPDTGRWQRDAGAAAYSAAKISVQRLVAEAASEAGRDEHLAKMLLKSARRYMGRAAIDCALKLAQSEAAMIGSPDDWDAHPLLLNCANGTVDLRDGKLHSHKSEDRLTKTTGVVFRPDAPAPLWVAFLERVLPEPGLRDYMQRAIGYGAIGSVTEHVLHVLWGGGANGKSVLCGTIETALGEYAVAVPPSLLVSASGFSEHPTIRTILHGARFALASETAEGGRFDEAALKALTGGDMIRARGMRQDWWEFPPSHTLFLQTNHRPRVKEVTLAFWRRMRLVPFNVTIPADQQDKRLPQKLQAQLPGVLAWIIAGAVAYQRDGLDPPALVVTATTEYQNDQDVMREFVERYEAGGFTSCEDLHKAYKPWAESLGLKPWGQRTLTGNLKDRGWQYLEHHRPRGFAVVPVPERNSRLNSSLNVSQEPNGENTVSNGCPPASGSIEGTSDDVRNGGDAPKLARSVSKSEFDRMNWKPAHV